MEKFLKTKDNKNLFNIKYISTMIKHD